MCKDLDQNQIKKLITKTKSKINKIYLIGNEFYNEKKEETESIFFKTKSDFKKYLESHPIKENNILIKGSRAMRMEEIVEIL